MVRVQESITIARKPSEVMDLVMDIERYATLDTKIDPVLWSRHDGDVVEFACRPTLAGLPQPPVIQHMRQVSAHRIEISLCPLPANRAAHAVAAFEASAEVTPEGDATRFTRTLEFTFSPAVRWFFEPLFRRRLRNEVVDELQKVQHHLEEAELSTP